MDEDAMKQLASMSWKNLQDELVSRGVALDKIAAGIQNPAGSNGDKLKDQLIHLLSQFLRAEGLASKAGVTHMFKAARKAPSMQFFSEVIMQVHENDLLICAPSFPSPRDRPVTVVVAMDLTTHVWRTAATTGLIPNPFMVFKRMPIYFVASSILYVAYPNTDRQYYAVHMLDLRTWVWTELKTTGTAPPVRDHTDGCYHSGQLIVSGHTSNTAENSNVVHSLDLATGQWAVVPTTGTPSTFPNSSSVKVQDQLYIFSKDGDALHTLDLASYTWRRIELSSRLPQFSARRHSHLIQVLGEKLYLLRACDNFEMHVFNTSSKEWSKVDTIGKRPCNVRTEASFCLHGGTMYVLGGQADKNHLLLLHVQAQPPPPKKPDLLSILHAQDEFKDVLFELPLGHTVRAHSLILSIKSQYFKMMLLSGMEESRRTIQIRDVDLEIFEAVICYLYGQLDLETCAQRGMDFGALFMAADKYLLIELQELVAAYITRNLDPPTAITALKLFTHASPGFPPIHRKQVLDYMCLNAAEVAGLPEFKQICQDDPELVQEVFKAMASEEPLPKRLKIAATQGGEDPVFPSPNLELWFTAEDPIP